MMSSLPDISSKLPSTRTTLIIFCFVLTFSLIYLLNYPSTSNTLLSTASTLTSQFFSSFSKPGLANNTSTNLPSSKPVANDTTTNLPSSKPVANTTNLPSTKESSNTCDIFDGRWVSDDSYPIYPPGSCPYVDGEFNCFRNGRSDFGYLKYRWQPHRCDLPRFDGKKMMEMLRGKKMVFIGDSLNRNMCQSLICSLKMFKPQHIRSSREIYLYNFKDYNCSIMFVMTPFLVHRQFSKKRETLRLDILESSISNYHDADFLIFNTGHWWNHNKSKNGYKFFQEGDVVHDRMDVGLAYTKALTTWANWVDNKVNNNKTQVFFAGFSNTHFRGGDWDSGGTCDNDTEPIIDEKLLTPYPWLMQELERVILEMKTPVVYLNITKLTDYRKDGHPSKFRRHGSKPQKEIVQDCSHWCLPGVPDSWNHLLFSSLLPTLKVFNRTY